MSIFTPSVFAMTYKTERTFIRPKFLELRLSIALARRSFLAKRPTESSPHIPPTACTPTQPETERKHERQTNICSYVTYSYQVMYDAIGDQEKHWYFYHKNTDIFTINVNKSKAVLTSFLSVFVLHFHKIFLPTGSSMRSLSNACTANRLRKAPTAPIQKAIQGSASAHNAAKKISTLSVLYSVTLKGQGC